MFGKLEIKLLNYFFLIAFAALLIGVEFYFELSGANLDLGFPNDSPAVGSETSGDYAKVSLHELRTKIVTMFGVLTVVVAIVLMMFIKNITMPLCKMVEVAQRINAGDLSQTIAIDSKDEIGQVGTAINELTSNLQEVAAFTATTATEALNKIDGLIDRTASNEDINNIKSDLQSLIRFVDSFKLLQTDITK